jgi:hypothetical protein
LSREGSLSCHTCCDTGPRFFRSHPKDRPIQSPLTTHEDRMWRIYSNPDPHGGEDKWCTELCKILLVGHGAFNSNATYTNATLFLGSDRHETLQSIIDSV